MKQKKCALLKKGSKQMKKIFTFFVFISLSNFQLSAYTVHVMKLGGSALTVKEKDYGVPRYDVIWNAAQEIAAFLVENPDHRIIVTSGTGSFAHNIASDSELHNHLNEENVCSVLKYHNGAVKLNKILVKALNDAGVRALPMNPMSCIMCTRGRISHMNTDIIRVLLDHGFVPVFHGDIVADEEKGMCILSSDQITALLGKRLRVAQIGYASVEDGVYGKNGEVISEINQENFDYIKQFIGGSECTDVTGGMFEKVFELLNGNAPDVSYIFNGTKKGNIRKFLDGKKLGTKIVKNRTCFFIRN